MYEDKCTQDYAPACNTQCPMHVDVKGMMALAERGDFDGAAKIFAKSILFPNIISRICDHPCQRYCTRNEAGGTILISKMERACMEYGQIKKRKIKPFKRLDMKVAIIGAGLDGLAAALFLYEKGYDVTVYDEENTLGGPLLLKSGLPQELIDEDFKILTDTKINFMLGQQVNKEKLLEEYDGVYDTDDPSFIAENAYEGESAIQLLCNGRTAGITLDRQMKKVSLTEGRDFEGPYKSELFVGMRDVVYEEAIELGEEGTEAYEKRALTMEEAIEEAKRCIQCECMQCVRECKFLQKYGSYPKKYVREIANNVNMTMGMRFTKFMVNECTFCGLCGEICPNKLNMGDVCREAKAELVENNHMPAPIHDFPINDMLFSNSPYFQLIRHEPGAEKSDYLFFPGCQLGALEGNHVIRAYKYLMEKLQGDVGIYLGCCGAPAEWAGRKPLFDETMEGHRKVWEEAGKPVVITACATCTLMFQNAIEELEIKSLWEVYDEQGLPDTVSNNKNHCKIAIHDACTARFDEKIQESVRRLAESRGYEVEELTFNKGMTKCCSYGGLVSFTNRELAAEFVQDRVEESDKEFVVYCAMCKERLTSGGKPSWHILDLLYGDIEDQEKSTDKGRISFSQRHENRIKLKAKIMENVFGEQMDREIQDYEKIVIRYADGVFDTVDDRLILTSDIQKVLLNAEQTGETIYNPKTGRYTASLQPGLITYWVEYTKDDTSYIIHKAYSHRLELNKKLEGNEHRKYKL